MWIGSYTLSMPSGAALSFNHILIVEIIMDKYQQWIKDNVTNPNLQCAKYTLEMLEAFPELKRVRGYYHDFFQGRRPHWWLVKPDGYVIDPTVEQFCLGGEYELYDESLGEPKGKCINCGELSYYHMNVCSKKCVEALEKD